MTEFTNYLPLILGLVVFVVHFFSGRDANPRPAAIVRWVAIAVSTALMLWLFRNFLSQHYEYRYVFENSDRSLPPLYRVSAVWAGQSGTFLMWYWFTALLLIGIGGRDNLDRTAGAAIGLALVVIGVFLVRSNPLALMSANDIEGLRRQIASGAMPAEFLNTFGLPANGRGLNPILKNPWMAIHPPLVFIGYALAAAPFAYAAAGVAAGDYREWAVRARPWATAAWALLCAGIFCGSYWAYEVLGWGGYWAWDPVENASVFPWLASGALAHGLIIQGRGRRFAFWNILMAFTAMALVLVTTFLTRSGAMADISVHSFEKSDLYYPILVTLLVFLAFTVYSVVRAALALKAEPGPGREPPLAMKLLSWTVIMFTILLAFVMLGTLYPLIVSRTVDASYYNKTSFIGMLFLGGLLAWCPFVFIKSIKEMPATARYAAVGLGALMGVVFTAMAGARGAASVPVAAWYVFAALAGAIIAANLVNAVHFIRLKRWNLSAYVVHLGVGLIMLGVVTSSGGSRTERVELAAGTDVKGKLAGYTFGDFREDTQAGNVRASIDVTRGSAVLRRELVFPTSQQGGGVKPTILRAFAGDLYLIPKDIYAEGGEKEAGAGTNIVITPDKPARAGSCEILFKDWNTEKMKEGVVIVIVAARCGSEIKELQLPYYAREPEGKRGKPVAVDEKTALSILEIDPASSTVVARISENIGEPAAAPVNGEKAESQTIIIKRGETVDAGGRRVTFKSWHASQEQVEKQAVSVVLDVKDENGQTREVTIEYNATKKETAGKAAGENDENFQVSGITIDPLNPQKENVTLSLPGSGQAATAEPAATAAETEQEAPAQDQGQSINLTTNSFTRADEFEFRLKRWSNEILKTDKQWLLIFDVKFKGQISEAQLPFDITGKAPLPTVTMVNDDGSKWRVTAFDPEAGTATMLIMGPETSKGASAGERVFIQFEALRKPFIALLWWGMLLVTCGSLAAVFVGKSKAPAHESESA